MSYVKMNIKQWPTYVRALGARMDAAVQMGIVDGAHECIPMLQRRTEVAPPASPRGQRGAFNTGNYRRRFRVRILARGATVYNDAGYADVIDKGRRKGKFPPLRPIEQWARRRMGLSAKEAKRAAYPIARAIARRGLKGRKVMSGAEVQMTRIVDRAIMRSLDRELGR